MALISSPVVYPSSSPPPSLSVKRKRQHDLESDLQVTRKALNTKDDGLAIRKSSTLPPEIPNTLPLKAPTLDNASSRPHGPFGGDDDDNDDDKIGIASNGSVPGSCKSGIQIARRRALPTDHTLEQISKNWQQDFAYPSSQAKTSSGKFFKIQLKNAHTPLRCDQMVVARSNTAPGRATTSYYGINVHDLLDEAAKNAKNESLENCNAQRQSLEAPMPSKSTKKGRNMLWTEKYRARKFTDLMGDERTHRDVLRWLKGWDSIVFPGTNRLKQKAKLMAAEAEPRQHRKILLLTGPPGLGKTTLAHVCARQAGYEVMEINASDERSRDVVTGRIKECVGTENVKGVDVKDATGTIRKAGRPICVIVDEVDGVVGGAGGGREGGFIKALIELVALDQKNSDILGSTSTNLVRLRKKGDRFRLLRPIILICNDVYHPALRHLRSSMMAEIIHIRRPPLDKIIARLKSVFEKEGVVCDADGVRRLCEATWGTTDRMESRTNSSGTCEGDMRGILVVSEWVAAKMRASNDRTARLTKKWVEEHMLANLSHEGGEARGLGRGGAKEVIERVFLDGAGFTKAAVTTPNNICKVGNGEFLGVSELAKHTAMTRLRDVVDTCGESDRIVTDCFTEYLSRSFQDDTFLSKPNAAHDWLHFHDQLSSKVYGGHEWELGPYLSQSVLGFYQLFASRAKHSRVERKGWDDNDDEPLPLSGPRADYLASEALKQNTIALLSLQSSLSTQLFRSFRSTEDISTDLLPSLVRILTPDVRPIVVGGSGDQRGVVSVRKEGEREMIKRAVGVMNAVGVTFQRARVDVGQIGVSSHIYRMEPPLDTLAVFETACQSGSATAPTRYAVRQALDQEYQKLLLRQRADTHQARHKAGGGLGTEIDVGVEDKENEGIEDSVVKSKPVAFKRDFFGRIVDPTIPMARVHSCKGKSEGSQAPELHEKMNVWVSYHEGFSNAVRKPITLDELMRGF